MLVKVCGITCYEDAMLAIMHGAWALGFNFYSKSPRFITPHKAREIINQLPSHIMTVGVFVNTPINAIETIVAKTSIHIAQLHGDESLHESNSLSIPVIKTIRQTIYPLDAYKHFYAVLIDAFQPGSYGGTGQCVDWNKARDLAKSCRTILAGGLTPQNVQSAITHVNPIALDVCSGVEALPGRKCANKMAAFFTAINSNEAII